MDANHTMTDKQTLSTPRELWMTPSVLWFLQRWGQTQTARQLTEYIVRALDGRDIKDGRIMFTGLTFLLYITDPDDARGFERVVVWHGPSDGGTAFSDAILEKSTPCGVDFV